VKHSRLRDCLDLDFFGDEETLCCPVCGEAFTHVRDAYTLMGCDEYETGVIGHTKVGGTVAERRSGLAIIIECEMEHWFQIILQQRKGNTFVTVAPIEPPAEDA
jgi:hypothetical protein